MDIEVRRQDIQEVLQDRRLMREILTEVTQNWDVQKELAHGLAAELSHRLSHYREIGGLLQDEHKLFELIRRLTLGDDPAEDVAETVETKVSDIQGAAKKLASTNRRLRRVSKRLKDAEQQVARSGRLKAVGELASGVIHEIKNPLGTIRGLVQLLEQEKGITKPQKKDLHTIETEIGRMASIIEKLRSFARPSAPEVHPVHVRELLDDTADLLHHQMVAQRIRLVKKYNTRLPVVDADGDQLRQVFVNLILNAVQAMPKGGKLTVGAAREGTSLIIEFADTGCGIPKGHLKKIFVPFFTTRKEGTGLGLAISHGIVGSHKGSIEVSSVVNKGTTVSIKLPLKRPRGK